MMTGKRITDVLTIALVFTSLCVHRASAQETIAEYLFTSGSTASTGPLGSSIGFEPGITGSDASSGDLRINGLQTTGAALGGTVYTDVDQGRIATENWVTFSIIVPSAQEIDLTSLDFDYTDINPAQFLLGVYSSKTGFTEDDHLLGLFPATANSYSVDLSGTMSLQNLSGETIEFRFLLGDDSGSPTRIHVLDNITLSGVITDPAVALSANTVASNAPPGTLVGNLSMIVTNGAFTYTLTNTVAGPDSGNFSIASGSTNLRTAVWMNAASNNISIVGTETGGGGLVVTNDFTITTVAVAADPIFVVSAEVEFPPADGDIVGVMTTATEGVTFSFVAGRDDLFTRDANNNLIVTNSGDWGALGTTSHVTLRATNGSGSTDMVVGVVVVNGTPAGTIFMFQ